MPDSRWVKLGKFGLYAVNPLTWGKASETGADWFVDTLTRDARAKSQLLGEPERELGPDDAPSFFLREEHRVVDFTGRVTELERLSGWATDPAPLVSTALITGGPGSGKTRLARRLCEIAYDDWNDPWLAGSIDLDDLPPQDSIGLSDAIRIFEPITEWRGPVLLVVDYAERKARYVEAILKAAIQASRGQHQFRVVLVARSEGDWLERLRARFDADLDDPFAAIQFVALPPLTRTEDAHNREFGRAFQAFRRKLQNDVDAVGKNPKPPKFASRAEVLDVHVAALLAAYGESLPNAVDEEQLLDTLLRREAFKHWQPIAEELGLDGSLIGEPLRQAIAWLAMVGDPVDDTSARQLLEMLPNWHDQQSAALSIALRAIKHIYPGVSDAWWSGIRPDRLATFLTRAVPDEALEAGISGLTPKQIESTLTQLTWSRQRAPDEKSRDRDAARMRLVIEAGQSDVLPVACSVAIQHGDPLGRIAADWLRANPDIAVAEVLNPAIPDITTALRELGEVVLRILYRSVTDNESAEALAKRAGLANNLANRLRDLGRREEAFAVAEEALALYRYLAEARPDAFLPYIAGSLHNLATYLSDLGRREEAHAAGKEAVAIRRDLADARPDAFRPELAISLNNLANRLVALGRSEEALVAAEEAVAVYRGLADARPEALRPDLASFLNNVASILSDLGRWEEAYAAGQEALDIRRDLAHARPDAFRPVLADSLNNLGNFLSSLGNNEEALGIAEEAVAVYRGLADARPEAFRPDLAMSLNNFARFLNNLGRGKEALAAAQEAIDIRRDLADARPDAFRPGLAMSLGVLGLIHLTDSNYMAARGAFGEGIRILSAAFESLPAPHARLISTLVGCYVRSCEGLDVAPDETLLAPILARLATLAESQPPEVED